MGNLMESFCCIDNNDIINNQNFPISAIGRVTDEKYRTNFNSDKSKVPANKISLGLLRNISSGMIDAKLESPSQIPISTKDIIVAKKGDPFEDYEIITKLGEGTYGKVYKVRNRTNNTIRAMKQIGKQWLNNKDDNEVMKEIEILQKLTHPYIIKLYEYYVTDDSIFIINELCNEGDLHGKINKIGIFPEFIVKIIMLQVFKALSYLNEKRIIHGDLKLENIMVECYDTKENNSKNNDDKDGFIEAIKNDMSIINGDVDKRKSMRVNEHKLVDDLNRMLKEKNQRNAINSYGSFRFRGKKPTNKNENKDENKDDINNFSENSNIYDWEKLKIFNYGIKLIDFGCSKMFNRTKKNFNDIIGTLVYCSPEVLANNYNESCDIWSCGVLMYCLLSGYFPFRGEDEEEVISKILSGKFEFDIENFNNISDEAKDLISKCLIQDITKRITIQEALNHKFFNDLRESSKYTKEEKIRLINLKHLTKHSKFYQLVLTYLSHNFSDNKLLNELTKLYNKLDKNCDYKITKAELYNAYKDANIPMTQEEIDNIMNSIDFDQNGTVDYEEFIRMCIPKEQLFTDANLQNAFLLFDTDRKGFITPSEIIDFIQSHKQINEELKRLIKEEILDITDEIIDAEEFKRLMINLSNKEM
jgi:serine/threonine protein kinase